MELAPADRVSVDGASRLSSFLHDLPGGASSDTATSFTYNPVSQIASSSRSNDLYAWNGAVTVNRLYVANGLNQYQQVASGTFAYDANGNLTSDGADTYTYDVENRMVGRTTSAYTAHFRYDPLHYGDTCNNP